MRIGKQPIRRSAVLATASVRVGTFRLKRQHIGN